MLVLFTASPWRVIAHWLKNGDSQLAKKALKRRPWTNEDVKTLKTLVKSKTPVAKIAKTLKRTEGATRQAAFQRGVSLDMRG